MGEVGAGMEKVPCRKPYFTRDLSETKKAQRFQISPYVNPPLIAPGMGQLRGMSFNLGAR